jgi:TolB-like protein/Tfp pilus assembly protein PilF
VLPFENLTGQSGDDWLAGAFSDAISAGLQPIETLILVPRERVVELYAADSRRESQALSSAIARQVSHGLKVKYYVHGSYERVGEDLRVRARLVDVEADSIRAQETITDRFANILALEDALAARLADRLGPTNFPAVGSLQRRSIGATPSSGVADPVARPAQPPATGPSDLRAYQLVTDARAHYALGEWDKALPLLEEAVKRDPKYAMAWAMLSKTHSRAISPASAAAPDPTLRTAALQEAIKAADLAPTLVEAHIALALAHRSLAQRDALRAAAEQAVRLNPRIGEPRILLGDALSNSPGFGCPVDTRPDDAILEYREALRIDPLESTGYGNLTTVLWWMGRPVEALETQEAGLAAQPRQAMGRAWVPFNMVFAGKVDEAEAILAARSKPPIPGRDEVIYGYIALARKRFDQADARFAAADAKGVFGNLALTLITSVANFQAGRADQGGAYLSRGIRTAPECAAWAMQVPALAPFRATPAFKVALGSAKR